MKKIKNLLVIQARMGSERFPGKVLLKLGRITILEWVIRASKKIREKRNDINFNLVGPLDPGNPSSISEKQIKSWENQDFQDCFQDWTSRLDFCSSRLDFWTFKT